MWRALPLLAACLARGEPPRNILHVVYDDFRVDLPIYGQAFIHAPAFTALAARGVVFDRAYCQIAVCSPSRNSFLSGRMPRETQVWNFFNSIREATCPPTLNETLEGTVLATWTEADPQQSGGAGGCCTTCTGAGAACAGWSYVNKTCTTFSAVRGARPCAPQPVDPSSGQPFSCMRGARGAFPTVTTLPQRFREAGWLTMGVGKLFHDGGANPFNAPDDFAHPPGDGKPPLADPLSWSAVPEMYPQGCTWGSDGRKLPPYTVSCAGLPTFGNAYSKNKYQLGSAYLTPAVDGCDCKSSGVTCIPLSEAGEAHLASQGCSVDVGPDGVGADPPLQDVPVQIDARAKLAAAASHSRATGAPFFLEVGFKKPHLVWAVPQAYLDLYPRGVFTPRMPNATVLDASVDPVAWTPFFTQSPAAPLSPNATLELRRYYYAAISWADFHLGQLLEELDAQNLTNSTAVLVHADHGWHTGEVRRGPRRANAPPKKGGMQTPLTNTPRPLHPSTPFQQYNMWEKRTLWEAATRVPFVLSVPWMSGSHGRRAAAPVELVDVMPTLLELGGVAPPQNDTFPLAGTSIVPLLADPSLPALPNRAFARSTYPRCPRVGGPVYDDACIHVVERTAFPLMGYSIRNASWRFTAFFPWDGATLAPAAPAAPRSVQLYDHRGDAPGGGAFEAADFFEDVNVAAAHPDVAAELLGALKAEFGL